MSYYRNADNRYLWKYTRRKGGPMRYIGLSFKSSDGHAIMHSFCQLITKFNIMDIVVYFIIGKPSYSSNLNAENMDDE